MKRTRLQRGVLVTLMSCTAVLGLQVSAAHSSRQSPGPGMHALRHLAIQELAALPLRFEPNRGQAPATIRFIGRGAGYTVALSPRDAVLASSGGSSAVSAPAHLHLVGANPHATFVGLSRLPGTVNYLRGEHPSGWQLNLPTYGQVIEREVYPGIDLLYHSSAAQLEYDWLIHPGADPHPIALSLGAGRAVLSSSGDLLLRTRAGVLLQHRPHAYQTVQGRRVTVSVAYVLQADGIVTLRLGTYRHALELVIDPTLAYSTYIVSGGESKATTIAVDATGSAYVGGNASNSLPLVHPIGGPSAHYASAPFLAKLSADGSQLVYSTYLGDGGSLNGIALDPNGDVTVSGEAYGAFPQLHPLPGSQRGYLYTGFVARLHYDDASSTLSLVYSTYLGGSGNTSLNTIATDAADHASVVGTTTNSPDFPAVQAVQACPAAREAVAARLDYDPTQQSLSLVYSTCLGGPSGGTTTGGGLALDPQANAYVTGWTDASDFPVTDGSPPQGGRDAYVTKLSFDGTDPLQMVYSTRFGGTGDDIGLSIAVDASGDAYVAGETPSANFPTLHPYQATLHGLRDAFALELDSQGHVAYSTFLGGRNDDTAYAIAVGSASGIGNDCTGDCNIFLTGDTGSPDFPTRDPIQPSPPNCGALLFVTQLDPASGAVFSTVLTNHDQYGCGSDGYAVALDSASNLYVAGGTGINFPTTPQAFQTTGASGADVVVLKIDLAGTTLAQVSRFAARRHGTTATFTWTVSNPAQVVGFNLLAGSHHLNRRLIPVHASPVYHYRVVSPAHGRYTLHVLLRDGRQLTVFLQ